ncbi:hypothetical protein FRC03_003761 [Tulasnella sp. 419]|nr:hypothetical protein FRC03_003761 [Tulasnella sp. 419]
METVSSQTVATASVPSRRSRERSAGQQVDIADRIFSIQRKANGPPKRLDRTSSAAGVSVTSTSSRPQQQPLAQQHQASPSRHTTAAMRNPPSIDEFDRTNPHHPNAPKPSGRLFNHHYDNPYPPSRNRGMLQHREPDQLSEASSTPPITRRHPASPPQPQQPQRQLFDPRKDDPVRFSVLNRNKQPPPPPVGGYVSASSTSMSDTQSLGSNFTLTSATTSSSASNPQSPATREDASGTTIYINQLKRIYREISTLEERICSQADLLGEDIDPTDPRQVKAAKAAEDKWTPLVAAHKTLAELDHQFLSLSLNPRVPASFQSFPKKYNIPVRMWSKVFQRLIASLRRASYTSATAQEHLISFTYYGYAFYSNLLEEEPLSEFRDQWMEALGDLSRYQMAVLSTPAPSSSLPETSLAPPSTFQSLSQQRSPSPSQARIDGSAAVSIGARAAAEMELEEESETWRRVAREWYARVLKNTPGIGRLHHNLGLLSRDAQGEELRAAYHFVKSLVTSHDFEPSRESIQPLFSLDAQRSRYLPSSPAPSIFLLMHGMLFTRIQLDDFKPTLARFMERLELDPVSVSESEWIMMAVMNIASVLEYGKADGVIKKLLNQGSSASGVAAASSSTTLVPPSRPRSLPKRSDSLQMEVDGRQITPSITVDAPGDEQDDWAEEERMEVDDLSKPMQALSTSSLNASLSLDELPISLQYSLQLTFEMLRYALKSPCLPPKSKFRQPAVNPYLTSMLTFLTTILAKPEVLQVVERCVPWTELIAVMTEAAKRAGSSSSDEKAWSSKAIGSTPPLPEDYCLRGMEWVKRVYERGFWRPSKSSSGIQGEMDVLCPAVVEEDVTDGIIEDDDGADGANGEGSGVVDWVSKRWKRLRWACEGLVRSVPGIEWERRSPDSKVVKAVLGHVLQDKMDTWRREQEEEEEAERRRRERTLGFRDMDEMEVDEEMEEEEEDEDDEDDSPEVKALKERRRYLRSLQFPSSPPSTRHQPIRSNKRSNNGVRKLLSSHRAAQRPALNVTPGYTILVLDTNIILSSLPIVSDLVASNRWTVVVPLAVVTELDGIQNNTSPALAKAAQEALNYLIGAVRTQSNSLKVQTSKGNYLSSLSVRSEAMDFGGLGSLDRNMDDMILRTAAWQADHFVDRSSLLIGGEGDSSAAKKSSKVVLLSFDRNREFCSSLFPPVAGH